LYIFIAHARNGHISTSGLKSDVKIVFLDPDFLKDAKISAIRVHLSLAEGLLIFAWIFRTSWPKMRVLGTKWAKGWCDADPNELVFTFVGSYFCANFGKNGSRNATVRVVIGHWKRQCIRGAY